MRVAVIGGTGLVGRATVDALERDGHDPVVVARSTGVDIAAGTGLAQALTGAEAVVDVSNTLASDRTQAEEFFTAATQNLLAAEERAGVRHHVLLSIVGVDQVEGNAHYAGKRIQESLVGDGPVPWTIVRATQFFEFPAMVVGWTREGDTAVVPPLLMQPIAVADVADMLVGTAVGAPRGTTVEVAGPEKQDLVDMARRTLAARGDAVRLVPSWEGGPLGEEMAGNALLPGSDARIAENTFEAWLATQRR